jgi:hypothetical protein
MSALPPKADIVQHVGGYDHGITPVAVAIFAAWLAT